MIKLEDNLDSIIKTQRDTLRKLLTDLRKQQDRLFSSPRAMDLKKIYLVGCGDSLFASLGVRKFFQEILGLDVEVAESMEFSRYIAPHIQKETAVFGISNSGRVSRTAEALQEARHYGAWAVAMTGNPDRSAAKEAEDVITGALPNIRSLLERISGRVESDGGEYLFSQLSNPGVLENLPEEFGLRPGFELLLFMLGAYFSSLAHLYCAALSIGRARGLVSPSQDKFYMDMILNSIEAAVRTAKEVYGTGIALAERFIDKSAFIFLGAGPSYGTAALSAAKLFEQPHLNGVSQYLEEWAHLQFFYTRPEGIPIFCIVPPGNSRDRAIEQIRGIRELGGTVVAICSKKDGELAELCDYSLMVEGDFPESFSPWVYGVPVQVFAVALLNLKGQPPIPSPYSFKKMMEINFRQIYQSVIKRR